MVWLLLWTRVERVAEGGGGGGLKIEDIADAGWNYSRSVGFEPMGTVQRIGFDNSHNNTNNIADRQLFCQRT